MASKTIPTKESPYLLGETMKGTLKLVRVLFPRKQLSEIIPGEFGILIMEVQSVEEGAVPMEIAMGTSVIKPLITIKGSIPAIEYETLYNFAGTLIEDARFGLQYTIEKLERPFSFETDDQKDLFLRTIFGDSKTDLLYDALPDPMDVLEREDIDALVKVKGIGRKTAEKLLARFRSKIGDSSGLVQLQEYGLTPNMVVKLQEIFHSVDTILYLLQNNPYALIDLVDGISWITADKLALNSGYNPISGKRIAAYTQYYLKDMAQSEGHSYISLDELVGAIYSIAPKIDEDDLRNMLHAWIQDGWLYYEAETRRIGLTYYRKLEEQITLELMRLQHSKTRTYTEEEVNRAISEVEAEYGIEYTDEQRYGIDVCLKNNVSIISGAAGCVDCDTEFFNGTEWKRIADYQKGDKVLQYNPDGTAELVEPLDYVKYPEENLWELKSKYGVDMCVSNEHNVYYITSKGNLFHRPFSYIKEAHERSIGGFSGKFITSFNYGGTGIDLSDIDIKIMLAVICDGSFTKSPTNLCRFHIKKERKKQVLRALFTEGGYQYKEHVSAAEGYTDFYFYAPRRQKVFTPEWYNCTHAQLQLICDNILQWDGHVTENRKSFSTSVKETADFVQFAFTACGYKAAVGFLDRRGQMRDGYIRKSLDYQVNITTRNLVSIGGVHAGNPKPQILPYKTKDGYKYCFTVPTHMWVMRRNGRILITGNTGKSTVVAPLVRLFKQKQIPFAQCSLSGKAASNLSDITGEEGYTIHRLLSYDGLTGNFLYNKQNNVPYGVIILDELSLVGGEIFLKLLQAIPSGSSLIMLGDPNQLEAIGLTNLLKDCLDSYVIPSAKLTKIHRQAARSGIITESLRVSAGENIVSLEPIEETRGVLKDLKIKTYLESGESQRAVFSEYKKLVDEGVYPDDITVVVPMRTRGDISCFELNGMIQEYINPGNNFLRGVTISTKEGGYILREGDRVLVTKNNYRTQNLSGDIVPVYNGNIGKIRTIDAQAGNIVVRFHQQGDIVVPREFWRTLELGYAITCHKFQGSASPYVIVGLDMSAYTLLSKEWLYTALTRAKKYCVLVGQINAIRKSVKISRVTVKRTWLQELLIYATQAILEDKPISFNFVDNINTYWWTPQELQRAMEMKREKELEDAEEEDD